MRHTHLPLPAPEPYPEDDQSNTPHPYGYTSEQLLFGGTDLIIFLMKSWMVHHISPIKEFQARLAPIPMSTNDIEVTSEVRPLILHPGS